MVVCRSRKWPKGRREAPNSLYNPRYLEHKKCFQENLRYVVILFLVHLCELDSSQVLTCTALLSQWDSNAPSDWPNIDMGCVNVWHRKMKSHPPLFLDQFLCRQDLLVELSDLLVMAVTLLVVWIQLQALTHLTADRESRGFR